MQSGKWIWKWLWNGSHFVSTSMHEYLPNMPNDYLGKPREVLHGELIRPAHTSYWHRRSTREFVGCVMILFIIDSWIDLEWTNRDIWPLVIYIKVFYHHSTESYNQVVIKHPIRQYVIHNTPVTAAEHKSEFVFTKHTPYLVLMDDFGENWPHHTGTALLVMRTKFDIFQNRLYAI